MQRNHHPSGLQSIKGGLAHHNDSASLSGSCWAEGNSCVASKALRPMPGMQSLLHARNDTPGSSNALDACFGQAHGLKACTHPQPVQRWGAGTDLQESLDCLMLQVTLLVVPQNLLLPG